MKETLSKFKSTLSQVLINVPGWRTDRKIVVMESDDWGSIRMPSMEVFNDFVSRGFDVHRSDYNRLDTIESNEDLEMLFTVLKSRRDSYGNHLAVTANVVVGNPDFQKIKKSDFTTYYYEPVTETLKRYTNRDRVEILWKEGISAGIFHPQFHGREHVNVSRWMDALRKRTPEMMFTFDNETTFSGLGDYNYMEVLDYNTPEDLYGMNSSLTEGLNLFEQIFGYRSKSFIAPCYTWSKEIEESLNIGGVKYLQGLIVQLLPTGAFGKYRKQYHTLGRRNALGQIYLIRNCFFEPSLSRSIDPVGECLNRIEISFKWHKPAVICSHRINFIGSLNEKNRTQNLNLLNDLITRILKTWPDVEFMTSDQLGDLISRR